MDRLATRLAGAAGGVALLALAACTEVVSIQLRLIRVAPAVDPGCGAPAGARTVLVRAIGEFAPSEATTRSLDVDATALELDGFPAALAGLEVEVLGGGGERLAIGKSAPLSLADSDGADVAVFTAPLRGGCPTGPPGVARRTPLIARAGSGALIAGGRDADGGPVHRLERYDPARAVFEDLGEPLYGATLPDGLAGATMTTLADGRVAVVGGGATAYQVYDPSTGEIGAPGFLREARAFHAAAALPDGRLLLAGGCAQLDGAACAAGSALRSTSVLEVDSGQLVAGPPLTVERIAGRALVEADGRVLVLGGTDGGGVPLVSAERIDPDGVFASEAIGGTADAATRLPSGAVLSAFAPLGAVPSGEAAVLPPGALAASGLAIGPPRAGAALIELEDGSALATGGASLWFTPLAGRFDLGDPGGPSAEGAAVVRLDDGSVLWVGGGADGEALAVAWILRPELTGPLTGSATVTFGDAAAARLAVPRDPDAIERVAAAGDAPAHVLIASRGGGPPPGEWLVVGGPRLVRPTVVARVIAEGGVALLLGFVDEGRYHMVRLVPGESIEVVRIAGSQSGVIPGCRGQPLPADALDGSMTAATGHELGTRFDGDQLTVELDGATLLRCTLVVESGLVGVAPLSGTVRLDLLTVSR